MISISFQPSMVLSASQRTGEAGDGRGGRLCRPGGIGGVFGGLYLLVERLRLMLTGRK